MQAGTSGPVQIYKATYSSVPVYEFPCQGVAVMRRKSDGWLNATQILKVAGFDKPQRTRVLEREVQKGTHEKVQGGYGKYQGTWVPMDRGIALSRQYGVDRLLQPIWEYIPTQDSPPLAPKHITALPNKPKKDHTNGVSAADAAPMKAQRAAVNKAAMAARKAAAAESRRLAEEALEESDEEMMRTVGVEVPSERSRSPTPSEASETSETPSPLGSEVDPEYQQGGGGGASSSRKRKHQETGGSAAERGTGGVPPTSAHAQLGLGPLRYARMILDYFVSESTQVPQFLVTPPPDFDANVVIDDDGHTALHWACAMGRIRIVKLLLTAGADIFRANSMGQTALMRSVMFTNNYDLRKFPELFELLHRSTINIDRNDRTVFHYVVDIALQKGKTHAARYYIETILGRLVEYPKEVADLLNFQDEEGETALTLAARARSKRLVKILLDNGADPKIANRDNKTAEDYILEDERFRESEMGAVGSTSASFGAGANGFSTGPPPPPPQGGAYGVGPSNGAGPVASTSGAQHLLDPSQAGPAGSLAATVTGAPHPNIPVVFNPVLHTSETGRRAATKVIPEMANLLESLANSFDAELATKDRDLLQARTSLSSTQSEILESQGTLQSLQAACSSTDQLEAEEQRLIGELENKMGKRFRLGWEKWVRDEDAREVAYEDEGADKGPNGPQTDLDQYRSLNSQPPVDANQRQEALRTKLDEIRTRRKETFAVFARRIAESGTGVKMGQYRALIAMGCGVGEDQVDQVIESLCETLEAKEDDFV